MRCIKPFFVLATVTMLQACVVHVNADSRGYDISKVFGGVDVAEGRNVGDIESVNGGVRLRDNVTAGDVETVNGGVRIEDDVTVDSIETTNGGIRAGRKLKVLRDLETVNGGISIRAGSEITGDVVTVNGDIELEEVRVGGRVETVNGDIELRDGTVIEGDVIFAENQRRQYWPSDMPTLYMDRNSEVRGTIQLHQEVRLEIQDGAKISGIEKHFER